GSDASNARRVGTGPVRFVPWTKDDRTVLATFPDYWGGKLDLDRVVFRPIPETAARVAALLKGEIDLMALLPPDHLERVSQHATTRTTSALSSARYVLAAHSEGAPLDSPLVKAG